MEKSCQNTGQVWMIGKDRGHSGKCSSEKSRHKAKCPGNLKETPKSISLETPSRGVQLAFEGWGVARIHSVEKPGLHGASYSPEDTHLDTNVQFIRLTQALSLSYSRGHWHHTMFPELDSNASPRPGWPLYCHGGSARTGGHKASCPPQAVCLAHTPSLEDQQCIKDL